MVFDQTIYVANTSEGNVYVRTTYEKWQQLKFSTEVKLMSGTSTGGGFDFQQASDFTEGYTALAPHHTLKMIGSFFSAEVNPPAGAAAAPEEVKRVSISRNYRVPNKHSVIVTPLNTLQVVRGRERWKERCMEICPFMFQEEKDSESCWKGLRGKKKGGTPRPDECTVCHRGGRPQL